jgi:penicillin amidase
MHKRRTIVSLLIVATMLLSTMALTAAAPSGVDAPLDQFTIIRDDYGVPHVYAATRQALYYGIGYAQGQDRLWQADLLRHTVTGTSAEFFGPGAVDGDIFARTMWGPQAWREAMLAASPETEAFFQWFAAGMNAWIDEATQTGRLPVEYAALGLSPRHWTPDDSVAVLLLIFGQFGEFGAEELTNAAHLEELIARFGPAEGAKVWADTHWLNDPDARTTVPGTGILGVTMKATAPKLQVPAGVDQAYGEWQRLREGWEQNLDRLGIRPGPASNAVAFGSSMTADGRALVLAGPQMGYSVPQISHEIGMHQGNMQATGISFAGMPGVAIGTTEHFAWTFTSGISDNSDIYVEVLNPANPHQYLFQGQWHDLDCRIEMIHVRGAADVDVQVCKSIHGPVVGTAPGMAFTLKTASRGLEIQSFDALYQAQQARTMKGIDQAMSNWAPNFNLTVADKRGNIAYWHVGKIPVRAPQDNPWLPHDGTGQSEWQGFVPWAEMPHVTNPEQGWLVNWNNKPAVDWDNSIYGFGDWGPVQRVDTLFYLVEGLQPGTVTVQMVEEINRLAGWTTDTPSGSAAAVFAPTLLDDMLAFVDTSADVRLPGIVDLLAHWDLLQLDLDQNGQYDSPAVAVFNTWWLVFVDRVYADDLGGAFDLVLTGNLTYRMLDPDPALPLRHDYLGGETAGEALTASLIDTLNALTANYGSPDPANWLQPIAEIVWQPLGVGTVPNTIWMNRGTYNQITHQGPGPELYAENVVSPGQSGDPFSPHFADQLPLYATWTYKSMNLSRQDLEGFAGMVFPVEP